MTQLARYLPELQFGTDYGVTRNFRRCSSSVRADAKCVPSPDINFGLEHVVDKFNSPRNDSPGFGVVFVFEEKSERS